MSSKYGEVPENHFHLGKTSVKKSSFFADFFRKGGGVRPPSIAFDALFILLLEEYWNILN